MTSEVLELESRKNIFKLVQKYPGCHMRKLSRLGRIPVGSLRYHLNYLVRHSLLLERQDGKTNRYFTQEFTYDKKLMSFLRQKSIRQIIICLLQSDATHENIVSFVKLSPSTISWHLHNLLDAEVLTSKRTGRHVMFHLEKKDEMRKMLIHYQETFFDTLVDRVVEMWE